jgi:hypothetical protein
MVESLRPEGLPCPISGSEAAACVPTGDGSKFECPRCGTFYASATLLRLLENRPLSEAQSAFASSWIHERPNIRLLSEHEEILRTGAPPPVHEEATRLLMELARRHPLPGERFKASFRDPVLRAIAWAVNDPHMVYLLLEYLGTEKRYLTIDPIGSKYAYRAVIAPAGWAYLESLKYANPLSEIGFIAMWFTDETRPLRDHGLKPGIAAAGYNPLPIDEHRHNNPIDSEIIATIRRSRLLVADVFGDRSNVYYEAGFARGLPIPVFWTCRRDQLELAPGDVNTIRFDIRQNKFASWTGDNWPLFAKELADLIEGEIGAGPLKRTPA